MYQKFKNCLLFPRQIAQYIDDKFSKNLIYFLILLLIYCIPSVVKICCMTTIDSSYGADLVEEFTSLDYKINYKLENNELVSTTTTPTTQVLKTSVTINRYDIPVYVTFTDNELDYNALDIKNDNVVLIKFYKSELQISLYTVVDGSNSIISGGSNSNETRLFKKSYEQLSISDVDFSKPFSVNFKNQILSTVNTVFTSVKRTYLALFIFIDLIAISLSLLVTLLLMSLLVKIFVNPFGIKFGKVFTMFMLCTTPSVITEILYQMTGISIIYYLGDLLIFIYVFRTFISYLNMTNKIDR